MRRPRGARPGRIDRWGGVELTRISQPETAPAPDQPAARRSRWRLLWAVFCLLSVAAALLHGILTLPPADTRFVDGEVLELQDLWQTDGQDGSASLTVPAALGDGLVLCLENRWVSFSVELDGETLYRSDGASHNSGAYRIWLALPAGAAGKTLTLRPAQPNDAGFASIVLAGHSWLGSAIACARRLLAENLYAVFFACFAAVLCFSMLFVARMLRRRTANRVVQGALYLALFFAAAGVWVLTDSQFALFFTARVGLVALVSFTSFMAMPIALLLFLRGLFMGRYRWLERTILLMGLVMAAVLLGNALFGLALGALLPVYHLLMVAALVQVIAACLHEKREYGSQELNQVLAALLVLGLTAAVALAVFYVSPRSPYALVYTGGIFLFCLCLAGLVQRQASDYLRQTAQLATYQEMAFRDALTGLGTRTAYREHCAHWRPGGGWAFVVLDVNDLKLANDQYGHEAGDWLLRDAARCIDEVFGAAGRCYRLGGDEFLVVLEERNPARLQELADRLRTAAARLNAERAFPVSLAVGWAIQQPGDDGPEALFRRADGRMYENKTRMKQAAPR